MKNLCLILSMWLITTLTHAQLNVVWGEFVKAKGHIISVMAVEGSGFYTWSINNSIMAPASAYIGEDKEVGFWLGVPDRGITYLSRYEKFSLVSSGEINSRVGKEHARVENVLTIGGEAVVFLSVKTKKERILYMQKYNAVCQPAGQPQELMRCVIAEDPKKGSFNVVLSQNKKFVAVEYGVPGSKKGNQTLSYKVFTADFENFSEGKYELVHAYDRSDIGVRYLSETGDYFITAKIYQDEQKDGFTQSYKAYRDYNVQYKDNCVLDKIILVHVARTGVKEYELKLEGKKLFDLYLNSDNQHILTLTGIYGERKDPAVKGVFYHALDFQKQELINEVAQDFQQYFNAASEDDTDDAEEDTLAIEKEKKKKERKLFNYTIREVITEQDGSTIGLLEQYAINIAPGGRTTGAGMGGMTTGYSVTIAYVYRDLILYKMNADGTFAWVKRIPKNQITVDDYGILSSVARYTTADKMTLFFNDNLKNYDEAGNWNGKTRNVGRNKKTNTIAKVEIDLESGDMTRVSFFDRQETEAYAIPKLFQINYETREILMTLEKSSKEKFGLMVFEE